MLKHPRFVCTNFVRLCVAAALSLVSFCVFNARLFPADDESSQSAPLQQFSRWGASFREDSTPAHPVVVVQEDDIVSRCWGLHQDCHCRVVPLQGRGKRSSRSLQQLGEKHIEFEGLDTIGSLEAWAPFLPTWPCFWGLAVAGSLDDPAVNKFVCGLELYHYTPCVVYSFGSNMQMEFESSVQQLNPDCEIHTFDPTVTFQSPEVEQVIAGTAKINFHKLGLAGNKTVLHGVGKVDTLANIARSLGHTHIDILKIDVEGAEYSAVQSWKQSKIPSVGQVLMEVHEVPRKIEKFRNLMNALADLDFKHVHIEMNGANHAEIVMVQRTFIPGFRSYPMTRAAQACSVRMPGGPGPPSTSYQTMIVDAERAAASRSADAPPQIMRVSANYPCAWTEEFAETWPVCGLREVGVGGRNCTVLAMNSVYVGPTFRRAVEAIAPNCRVSVVQVRKPPLTRPDRRCGAYLSPDFSGPARCADPLPCCASSGSWCGSTPRHCAGHDYRNDAGEGPLFSVTPFADGHIQWVESPRVPELRSLDVLQASGPSVTAAISWLKAGHVAGQVTLDLKPDEALTSARALEALGFRTYRKAYLAPNPAFRLGGRVQLAMVSKRFDPYARIS